MLLYSRLITGQLSTWPIDGSTISDEQQDSIQQIENGVRTAGMVYSMLINKSRGFSQSLSRVLGGCDITWQKPNIKP
jgi:hypothetical protein